MLFLLHPGDIFEGMESDSESDMELYAEEADILGEGPDVLTQMYVHNPRVVLCVVVWCGSSRSVCSVVSRCVVALLYCEVVKRYPYHGLYCRALEVEKTKRREAAKAKEGQKKGKGKEKREADENDEESDEENDYFDDFDSEDDDDVDSAEEDRAMYGLAEGEGEDLDDEEEGEEENEDEEEEDERGEAEQGQKSTKRVRFQLDDDKARKEEDQKKKKGEEAKENDEEEDIYGRKKGEKPYVPTGTLSPFIRNHLLISSHFSQGSIFLPRCVQKLDLSMIDLSGSFAATSTSLLSLISNP